MKASNAFLRLLFISYAVLLVFNSYSVSVSAGKGASNKIDGRHPSLDTHSIEISSLLPETNCSPNPSAPIKVSKTKPILKVFHKHNPCVKSNKIRSPEYLLKEILEQDQARVDSIKSRLLGDNKVDILKNSKANKLPAKSGRSIGTGNYVVQVGFGTPKKDMSIIFDTGSDLTWIQCQPCEKACYSQVDPIFDPSKSTSYSNVTCNTPECNQLKSATGFTPKCSNSTSACIYGIQYGDQSYSVGYFGRETLTIGPDVFPKFLVGCGQNQGGLFVGAAGLIGLGRNKISLVSQTASKYGKVFSYCLPSRVSSIGYLALGQTSKSRSVKFTPLLTDSQDLGFYVIKMTDFNVGGTNLGISNSVLASSGTIIDSGTVITRLPPSAYAPLRTAFRKGMSKYKLTDPISILDTCYDLTGYRSVKIPKVGIIYSPGIMVDVDSSGILIAATQSQICLAFASNDNDGDKTILGNTQQKKMEVIYDSAKGRIGFGPGSCG